MRSENELLSVPNSLRIGSSTGAVPTRRNSDRMAAARQAPPFELMANAISRLRLPARASKNTAARPDPQRRSKHQISQELGYEMLPPPRSQVAATMRRSNARQVHGAIVGLLIFEWMARQYAMEIVWRMFFLSTPHHGRGSRARQACTPNKIVNAAQARRCHQLPPLAATPTQKTATVHEKGCVNARAFNSWRTGWPRDVAKYSK